MVFSKIQSPGLGYRYLLESCNVQGLKLSAPLVLPLPPQKKEAPVRCYPPIRWKVKKHCLLEVEDV